MANWTILKEAIANVIKTNGNQEITGQVLQNTLTNIVNTVGENAAFAGIATLSTNPGIPDGPVFYIPIRTGSYPNFGGLEHDAEGQIAIFITSGDGSNWKKEIISDLYTHAFFNANIYKYGKKAYDKSLTLAQAIQAGKEAGINDIAKCICFFDGTETKLAFFNVASFTSGWDDEKNWFIISKSVFNKITGNIDEITGNINNIFEVLAFNKLFSVYPSSIYTALNKELEQDKKYIIALDIQTPIEPDTRISLSTGINAGTITVDIIKNKHVDAGTFYVVVKGSGEKFIRISDKYASISGVHVYDAATLNDMYNSIHAHLINLDNSVVNIPALETLLKEDYVTESISNIPGYYKAVDVSLVEADDTGYYASQKFDVVPGSVIKLKTLVTSSKVASYVFYKRDNSVDIDNIGGQSLDYEYKDVLIPDDVYHVAFSCSTICRNPKAIKKCIY